MSKTANNEALYSGFFDELEKLGYPVDELMKEAFKNPFKALRAMTPAGKMEAALANPSMTRLGVSPTKLTEFSLARQVNPALRSEPMKVTLKRRGPSLQPTRTAGGSSLVWSP